MLFQNPSICGMKWPTKCTNTDVESHQIHLSNRKQTKFARADTQTLSLIFIAIFLFVVVAISIILVIVRCFKPKVDSLYFWWVFESHTCSLNTRYTAHDMCQCAGVVIFLSLYRISCIQFGNGKFFYSLAIAAGLCILFYSRKWGGYDL